jgi:signal transduction histidine kinase
VEAGSRRAAYYSHLPPGTYPFTVLAANSDGIWNLRGASLRLVVVPSLWQTAWFRSGVSAGVAVAIVIAYRRRIGRLTRAQALREAYSRKLILAQERERKRIAHELHATVGQTVSLISRHALDGLAEPDNYELVTERFAKIVTAAREANEEAHRIAYNLRPPELDHLGLTGALSAIVERMHGLSNIEFSCEIDPVDSCFQGERKVHLCRIVQECLGNIVRHSGATRARLSIKRHPQTIRVQVEDNGRGFDQRVIEKERPGLGLLGIIELTRMLGSEVEIRSASGAGTKITITIDIQETT